MQLSSKMRFIAAQFDALLDDDLWLRSAAHANAMASILGRELTSLPGVSLTQRIQANEVFATIPREHVGALQAVSAFQVWTERINEARFVASFDTTEEDISDFIEQARRIIG